MPNILVRIKVLQIFTEFYHLFNEKAKRQNYILCKMIKQKY